MRDQETEAKVTIFEVTICHLQFQVLPQPRSHFHYTEWDSLHQVREHSRLLPVEGTCLHLYHFHSSPTQRPWQSVSLCISQFNALNQQKANRKSKTRFEPALPRTRRKARRDIRKSQGSNTTKVGSRAGKRRKQRVHVPCVQTTTCSVSWLACQTLPYRNLWNLLTASHQLDQQQ